MGEDSVSSQPSDIRRESLWGKYVEIRLKGNRRIRGLVIALAGDSVTISDEFKNLEEYRNYKPQIMGSCGVIYPHSEGCKWSEIDEVEVF